MRHAATEFSIPVQLHMRDGLREELEAHIARVNTGFLLLRSPLALDANRPFELFYLERRISCETVYCHREANSYRVGARMLEGTAGALRAERRIRLDACAQLNSPGLTAPSTVRVVDMSSSGLGVKLNAPLTIGDLAYVELEHGVAFGEVRHCEKIDAAWRAGIFVEEFISRVPGKIHSWPAHSTAMPARSGSFQVARALKTALFAVKKA
jgi:hypothetical protein